LSKKEERRRTKIETTPAKYNGLPLLWMAAITGVILLTSHSPDALLVTQPTASKH